MTLAAPHVQRCRRRPARCCRTPSIPAHQQTNSHAAGDRSGQRPARRRGVAAEAGVGAGRRGWRCPQDAVGAPQVAAARLQQPVRGQRHLRRPVRSNVAGGSPAAALLGPWGHACCLRGLCRVECKPARALPAHTVAPATPQAALEAGGCSWQGWGGEARCDGAERLAQQPAIGG